MWPEFTQLTAWQGRGARVGADPGGLAPGSLLLTREKVPVLGEFLSTQGSDGMAQGTPAHLSAGAGPASAAHAAVGSAVGTAQIDWAPCGQTRGAGQRGGTAGGDPGAQGCGSSQEELSLYSRDQRGWS